VVEIKENFNVQSH